MLHAVASGAAIGVRLRRLWDVEGLIVWFVAVGVPQKMVN